MYKTLDRDKPKAYIIFMTPVDLKAWRQKNALTQNQLASVLGVHVMTVSQWERGVKKIPPFLALALECLEKKGGALGTKGTKTKKERKVRK